MQLPGDRDRCVVAASLLVVVYLAARYREAGFGEDPDRVIQNSVSHSGERCSGLTSIVVNAFYDQRFDDAVDKRGSARHIGDANAGLRQSASFVFSHWFAFSLVSSLSSAYKGIVAQKYLLVKRFFDGIVFSCAFHAQIASNFSNNRGDMLGFGL